MRRPRRGGSFSGLRALFMMRRRLLRRHKIPSPSRVVEHSFLQKSAQQARRNAQHKPQRAVSHAYLSQNISEPSGIIPDLPAQHAVDQTAYQNVTAQSLKEIALKQAGFSAGDGVGWLANFESMAIKTVLRQLLSKWGELSIENNDILSLDEAPCISAEELRDTEFSEAKVVATVDTTTGEIVQPGDEVSQPQPANPNPFKLN